MRLPAALRLFERRPVAPAKPLAPPAPVKAAAPEAFELSFDRQSVRVAVKRLASSRRFTLRVRSANHDVVLTIPKRASAREARAFAERHAAWVMARLARLPESVAFAPGASIPFRGSEHRLLLAPNARAAGWAGSTAATVGAGGDPHFFARRIEDFLKREARRDLESAVTIYCGKLGRPRAPITLRDTTSRWGSCTATGRLNFSWRTSWRRRLCSIIWRPTKSRISST